MKKWCLLAIILFILPLISALELVGPGNDIYNLGDKLDFNLLVDEDVDSSFIFSLTCDGFSLPLRRGRDLITKKEGYKFEYSSTIPSLVGLCKAVVSLDQIGQTAESKEFWITEELDSTVTIKDNLVQLGQPVEFSGNIFKKDGTNINGVATIYFKQGGNINEVDTITVENGKFQYVFNTASKPAGVYDIEIQASDMFGNKGIFSNLTATLTSEITIVARSSNTEVLPSETIKISGEAVNIKQGPIEKANVAITVGTAEVQTLLEEGKFSEKIIIPDDIKSGNQNVHILMQDEQGNTGETDITINVKPVQTILETASVAESYNPSSDLKITPLLYDQAGDFIIEDIKIEIYNAKNKLELSETKKTNEELTYTLGQYSYPGTWKIKFISSDLGYEKTFAVTEVSLLYFELSDQTLSIVNHGNVKYAQPLEIELKGPEIVKIVKKLNLNPQDVSEIDLGEGTPTGTYTVLVQDQEFKEISIIGKPRKFNYDFIYYIAIAVVVILFLWWLSKKIFKKRVKKHKEVPSKVEKIRDEEQLKKRYKNEFLNSVLKKIQAREEKTNKGLKFNFNNPKGVGVKSSGYIQIPVPKKDDSKILDTVQKITGEPLWRILRKKGLAQKSNRQVDEKKKGLFSMFN